MQPPRRESCQPKATPAATKKRLSLAGLNRVVVVSADPQNPRILEQIDVGQRPNGISGNREGTRLFVVHEVSNDLKVIDTGSSSVLATVPVGRKPIRVVYHGS